MKLRFLVRLAYLAVILSMIGAVAATVTLTHNVPSTSDQVVTSTCSTLTLSTPVTQPGTSGVELMTCGSGAAFSALSGTSTPTFTLTTGYSSLRYLPNNSNSLADCGGGSGTVLTSGTAVSFTAGSYDYCAIYGPAPSGGLQSFTISWNQ